MPAQQNLKFAIGTACAICHHKLCAAVVKLYFLPDHLLYKVMHYINMLAPD